MKRSRKFWQLSPVEVFCSIMLSGILGAVFLPSLFNSGACGCKQEMEARHFMGTISRVQRAYVFENKQFARNLAELEADLDLSVHMQTQNYTYSFGSTSLYAIHDATPRKNENAKRGIEGYVGMVVFVSGDPDTQEVQTETLLCETKEPTLKRVPKPIFKDNVLMCPPGTNGYTSNESPNIEIRDRDWQLAYQSLNLAEMGKRDRAVELANTIEHSNIKSRALNAIATTDVIPTSSEGR